MGSRVLSVIHWGWRLAMLAALTSIAISLRNPAVMELDARPVSGRLVPAVYREEPPQVVYVVVEIRITTTTPAKPDSSWGEFLNPAEGMVISSRRMRQQ
ncbi:MAG: hypothetical protein HY462_00560 [Parcubacteria group bacterium]|nr:hypothetical protein [Parcubacteria group bacterium]